MVVTELDSFVQKFHQLWRAGLNAHLDLDTHAGNAWVGLRVQLGRVPGPPHHQFPPTFYKKKQDSPSRQRRRDRRAAARNANAEEAEKADEVHEEALDEKSGDTAEKVEENISSCEQTIEEIVVNERAAAAEAANDVTDFNCDICDSKFKNLRGLRAHKGRLHKATGSPITQLDGEDDTDCDTSEKCLNCTFVSDFRREDVEYTLEEIFPEEIRTTILSHKKVGDRLSADRLFSVLIQLPDDRRFSWPEMSADQAVVFKNVQMQ